MGGFFFLVGAKDELDFLLDLVFFGECGIIHVDFYRNERMSEE